jgi:peptide/nickel transport system substrate-binding protein
MAGRMASLVDADTGKAREGAVVVVDQNTVQLNLLQPDITIVPGMATTLHKSYISPSPLRQLCQTQSAQASCCLTNGKLA